MIPRYLVIWNCVGTGFFCVKLPLFVGHLDKGNFNYQFEIMGLTHTDTEPGTPQIGRPIRVTKLQDLRPDIDKLLPTYKWCLFLMKYILNKLKLNEN